MHVVAHSYGGVISLLAAAMRPEAVRSLTLVEPPAFGVARGHPAVEDFVARGTELWTEGPDDPGRSSSISSGSWGAARCPAASSPSWNWARGC